MEIRKYTCGRMFGWFTVIFLTIFSEANCFLNLCLHAKQITIRKAWLLPFGTAILITKSICHV